jgi:5-methylcytosine-specific restriction endonuclease McrA
MTGTRDPRLETRAYRNLARWILERDRYQCQVRGPNCTGVATEVDHVISRADGGAIADPNNLRASCAKCNGGRAAERTNARRRTATYRNTEAHYDVRM